MKKTIALMLLTILLISVPAAHAGDLSIQMIGPDTAFVPDAIDDMQLGSVYTIDGYALVNPLDFQTVDYFAQFGQKEDYGVYSRTDGSIWQVYSYSDSSFDWYANRFNDASWQESGSNAQFFWLRMDVTNRQKKVVDFIEEAVVKVIYQDDYEFTGWVRQIDNDMISKGISDNGVSRLNGDKADYPNAIVLNPDKTHAIDMMYTGHFVFGCTVPNAVAEDKKSSLRMEITLGGNELTYYINR